MLNKIQTIKFTSVFSLLFLFAFEIIADNITITGQIVSEDGNEPLIAATVMVPDAEVRRLRLIEKHNALTDIDGRFSITLPDKVKSIECRYLGYETKIVTLSQKSDIVIILKPSNTSLDEVVVTGYQKIEKRKLTASISNISVNDNMRGSAMSIDQALAGQVAGLASTASSGAPGASPKIRIRGTASLNGTQDPLWVLDGIPLEGTEIPSMDDLKDIDNIYSSAIAGINPSDIESITVLKDAAATAIYGARAANGVIVITTKSGKAGETKVNFSTRLTFAPQTSISRLNLLNSNEKVNLELDLLASDYTYRDNKGEVARLISTAGETSAFKAGGWNALSDDTRSKINALRLINTDWNDILFRNTFNQEYNLSLSGGNEKATYYTSVGYVDEKGTVQGVEANRLNVTAKTNYRLNRNFRVGASLFANRRVNKSNLTDADGFTNPVYYSRRANPYQTPYNSDGSYNYDTNIQGREDSDLLFNVFEERNNTSYELETKSLAAIFDAELRLSEQFKLISQLGFQLDDSNKSMIASGDTYSMRKDKERTTLASLNYNSFLPDGGKKTAANSSNSQVTWKLQGEYSAEFAKIHELELMGGTEIRKTWYNSVTSAAYGYDSKTLTTKPVIFPNESWAKLYPLYTETYTENAFASFYGTGSYTLLKKYTLGGSIRFDGSDLFGVDKKYRFLPLYSVSGLWRISEEGALKDSEVINNQEEVKKENIPSDICKNIRKDYEANHKPNNVTESLSNIPETKYESNNKSEINHEVNQEDNKNIADNNAIAEVTANEVPIDHDSEAKNEGSNEIQNFEINNNMQEVDHTPNSQKSHGKIDDENEEDSRIEGFNKALCNDLLDEDD